MTAPLDEAAIRRWLVDYLVTNMGCNPDQIDAGASMHDLGVGSRDAVVLTGELSELVGSTVSPVDFWQYPTVDALAKFLSGGEVEPVDVVAPAPNPGGFNEPIAVIGLGCRFPGDGADLQGPDQYWEFLLDGGSSVTEVPAQRWAPFDDGTAESEAVLDTVTRWGSYLSDVDQFDAEFFEIMPREAARMDPQQRLLLEVMQEALEHAGIPADSLAESPTGVFTGASVTDYGCMGALDLPGVDAWYGTGSALSIIANRVSYFFDLRGPSVTVDTACSSSLVAIHLACQSLRSGDSNLALAGGVNLVLAPAVTRSFDQAEALSKSGRCHAFDARADGFVRGEGAGVAVLKRLSDAVRDGDRVLAVIRGSAVNQDGRSNGLMAPNPAAQMAVLRSAYAAAGVEPREVDYVEAHGTGTLLGDPIEARALGTVLGRGRGADAPLLIGSVKSNLGHLEAAAGIAGFAKAVLALTHQQIPANLGYESRNPHIPFDKLRLKVVDAHTDWAPQGRPRRAGVSSFGFGGTNAHIVLEQAPAMAPAPAPADPVISTLVISGKNPARIASTAAMLADWMSDQGAEVALADIAHTLNHHRTHHPKFATVAARDRDQAITGLRALAAGHSAPGVVPAPPTGRRNGTVFVYSGQGSQWAGMARQLLTDEPAFAEAINHIEPTFTEHVGYSLRQIIADGSAVRGDAEVQPVLMGLQLALTELWRSYGVHPDAVIGHSMGEVTAAVVSGALSLADGLTVIATRSRLMSRLAGQGAVALINVDAQTCAQLIAGHPSVEEAGYLSPRQTVVAGLPGEIESLIAEVTAQNRFARKVNMEVASHTALMDPVLDELRAALADIDPRLPTIPFLSTVTGPESTPALDADYWVANVRRPVRLHDAVSAAAVEHGTFIEVSPHPTMGQPISDTLADVEHRSIGTLARDSDDTLTFRTNLNATHTRRPPPTDPRPGPPVPLPTTPWQHGRHWLDVRPVRHSAARRFRAEAGADSGLPPEWFCELTWPEQPLSDNAPDAAASAARWVVVGDAALGAEFTRVLGASVTVLADAGDADALRTAMAGATHVLYAPGTTAPDDLGYGLFAAARSIVAGAAVADEVPAVYFLTRNAQPVQPGDRANPPHALLWGLGRTLALEHPQLWGGVVDLDESVPVELAVAALLNEARRGGDEDQIVYRAGHRHVARLQPGRPLRTDGTLDPDGSYLVVGATGRIGPALIEQLAAMGARTVVAVSRNPGSRLDELTERLSASGTTLVTVAADASEEASLGAVFERFGADLPTLRGIYVAAFGGGPVTLADMTDADVAAMFRPKIDAVAVLHKLSVRHPVRQFVMFTSISGILGSRWLGHYAATTTYLDTFAYLRRAAGLPASAVNWGLWESLADEQTGVEQQTTVESGLEPMADGVAITALAALTGPDAPVRTTIVAADWPRLATAYRTRAALHIVDDLLPAVADGTAAGSADTEFRRELRAADPQRRFDLLTAHVTLQVAAAMGLASPQLLDPSVGFFQFGMDSLMSVTLQRSLSESLGQVLPASVVFDYPTVEALTDYLATVIPEILEAADSAEAAAGDGVGGGVGNGVAGVTEDVYDDLAEDELLQKLSERLS
ncbi:type I polyketide synthase [Mycobacterium sp. SMC-4]|uniref:type I polyketide synthase n=1 Tax=Mycobacterium sp. SMC-4 TaxID=2857059 RepID=UPI0021B17596|nr:type I polyketide synthase [Mycobacterium sp. SMC-4]UXA15916.1 SDR family NAD(P)-dependent oxidoreductase [Mycobacterium sp. SMC-4]